MPASLGVSPVFRVRDVVLGPPSPPDLGPIFARFVPSAGNETGVRRFSDGPHIDGERTQLDAM